MQHCVLRTWPRSELIVQLPEAIAENQWELRARVWTQEGKMMTIILFKNRIQIILNLNSIKGISHHVVNLGTTHELYLGEKD